MINRQFGFFLPLKLSNLLSLKKRIKKNEGFRPSAYLDKLGFPTIGYGHLIKKEEKSLLKNKFSKKYLSLVFNKDFQIAVYAYQVNYKKNNFSQNIKEVLIEMAFQLGLKNQKKFIKMNNHIMNNRLFMAAFEMKNSLWFLQTPKRVDSLIKILLKKEM